MATRENFRADNYDEAGLEKIKLQDGIRIHEHTKVQLDIYARENQQAAGQALHAGCRQRHDPRRRPPEEDRGDDFFEGRYKGRVITVHSNQSGEEKDETVQQLLTVEDPANPTEIVIHVNMLKEGWDVTNLYTIVPLRAANSKTLVEQSIGRGLRLPYGKRTGVPDVDRLTIVSHDRFQEIVDHANDPNSIIRTGVVIGRDIPDTPTKAVTIQPVFMTQLGLAIPPATSGAGTSPAGPAPTITEPERKTAELTMQVIRQQFERLARSGDLRTADVQQRITSRVTELMQPVQGELPGVTQPVDVASVVDRVTSAIAERTIDIPKIIVTPKGEVTVGYQDFDLDCGSFRQPPAEKDLLVQHLMNNQRFKIVSGDGVVVEKNLEDYIVRGLIDKDDINYDEQAELLYKLATQMVRHLQSYLQTPDDVLNVLQFYQAQIVTLIHTQMNQHYVERATEYEVTVSKGFQTLTSSMAATEPARRRPEVPVHECPIEPDRLEDLGPGVGGDRRDAHLRHHLQHALARGLQVLAEGLPLRNLAQQAVAHHLGDRLEREVRVHGRCAVTDQQGEVVHLPGVAALDDEPHPGPLLLPHEMVVHSSGEKQATGSERWSGSRCGPTAR